MFFQVLSSSVPVEPSAVAGPLEMLFPSLLSVLLAYLFSVSSATQLSDSVQTTKFPWINKFASIGDSYAAGLGAGERIDYSCSRYALSHPNLLQSSHLGDNPNRKHQFLACSGAAIGDVLQNQVPALEHNLDLLTISAGGNDIGLSPILNSCIYQFHMDNEDDCRNAVKKAQRKIADEAQLYAKVANLIDAVTPRMNKTHGIIYLTGYAGFFGTDDKMCDNVTWSVWRSVKHEKQFLKLDIREQLNDMVHSVNNIIRTAAEDAGHNVRFIDYNDHIKHRRGRYCEAGVQEPSPNRVNLSFYEWDTVDNAENSSELKRTGDDVPRGSFEGQIAEWINKTLQEHPDWEFDSDKGAVNKSKIRPDGLIDDWIWWLLPDNWKRVFHLRPEAHAIVAQLIVDDLEAHSRERQDSIALLLWVAAGGLASVVILLMMLFICRRREKKEPWAPVWIRHAEEEGALDDSDDETLADPSENDAPNVKNYNTFN